MRKEITINDHVIGPGHPTYIIAEMSANHGQSFDRAVELVHAAKEMGADAIKLQTYTADTMTIACDREEFRVGKGTLWAGKTLYELYKEAYTPWDWQPKLKNIANGLGMDLFSTPFDSTAVDFLEDMEVPAYKIASFELVDIPLIRRVARTEKPVILSTGMGSVEEIQEAVNAVRNEGNNQMILLKCTSAYPAEPKEMHLRTIPDMAQRFGMLIGLSDHSLGTAVPLHAVALGACVIEKHFCLSRSEPGPDSAFSLEPHEFKEMVHAIRNREQRADVQDALDETILGNVQYGALGEDRKSLQFRRSIFAVKDIAKGENLTEENIRIIRPAGGLEPKVFPEVLNRKAKCSIKRGTPLSAKHLSLLVAPTKI
ncbi:MAG: pseudaminic acid synthase [Candidatus Peribacteraceae bacterium]|nr:pseudaminic acid synthase [Candidatus Peribacteraceae bacterium]